MTYNKVFWIGAFLLGLGITSAEDAPSLESLEVRERELVAELEAVRVKINQVKGASMVAEIKDQRLDLNAFLMELDRPAGQIRTLKTDAQKLLFTERLCDRLGSKIDGRKAALKLVVTQVYSPNQGMVTIGFDRTKMIPFINRDQRQISLSCGVPHGIKLPMSKEDAASIQPGQAFMLSGTLAYAKPRKTTPAGYNLMTLRVYGVSGIGELGKLILTDSTVLLNGKTYQP